MAAIEQFDVFAVARPAMTERAKRIGHTVFLGVWGHREPTIFYRERAKPAGPSSSCVSEAS